MEGMRNRNEQAESGAALVEWALVVVAFGAIAASVLLMQDVIAAAFFDSVTKVGCITMEDGTRVGECHD